MSNPPDHAKSTDAWVRWGWFWNLMAYAFLGVACLVFLAVEDHPHRQTVLLWLLAFSGWYSAVIWLPRTFWTAHPWLTLLYFAVGLTLWMILIQAAPLFNFLAAVLYPMVFMHLPLAWAVAAALALVAAQTGSSLYMADINPWLAVLLGGFSLAVALAIGLFIHSIIEQSHERRRLIEELNHTRDELARAGRQAGMLAERQRLAGEIHDNLAQGFTSIVMHLEAADGALARDLPLARQSIDQARQTARDSLAEARRMVWTLRPDLQERRPLANALQDMAARWAQANRLEANVFIEGQPQPLAAEIEVTIVKAAQEGLANIRKYAAAKQVVLTLTYMEDMIALDVRDDGCGFNLEKLATHDAGVPGGFGLKAMRASVERLGGVLTIESAPGEGTSLAVSLPLEK